MSQGRGNDAGDPVSEDPIVITNTAERMYIFTESELKPFSRYDFTVTASTSFGEGGPSSPAVSCDTEPGGMYFNEFDIRVKIDIP